MTWFKPQKNHAVLFLILVFLGVLPGIFPATASAFLLSATLPAEPKSLDPHKTPDPLALTYIFPCYQRLTSLIEDSIKPVPSLALTWRISDDGTIYTFVLKQGLTFTDGLPVNAQAVLFSFQRAVKLGAVKELYFPDLLDVQVLGPYTISFFLKQPSSSFLRSLATAGASIVSPGIVKHPADYLDRHTLGSGPYKLEEWLPGKKITLTVRQNQQLKPSLDQFDAYIEPAAEKRLEMLASGRVQIAVGLSPRDLEYVTAHEGLAVSRNTGFTSCFLAFNCQRPWLDQPEVRRALSMAINIDRLIQNVQGQAVRQMHGPVPLGMWGRRVEIKVYEYLPYTSRELIKNLGLPNRPLDLVLNLDSKSWSAQAEIIKANLKAAGIEVNLVHLSQVEFERALVQGDYDLVFGRYTPLSANPVDFLDRLLCSNRSGSSGNLALYRNPQIDLLLQRAGLSHLRDDLFTVLVDIMNLVIDDAPYVFLYQTGLEFGLSDRLKGFSLHPALPLVFPLDRMSIGPAGSYSEKQQNIPIIIQPENQRTSPRRN